MLSKYTLHTLIPIDRQLSLKRSSFIGPPLNPFIGAQRLSSFFYSSFAELENNERAFIDSPRVSFATRVTWIETNKVEVEFRIFLFYTNLFLEIVTDYNFEGSGITRKEKKCKYSDGRKEELMEIRENRSGENGRGG